MYLVSWHGTLIAYDLSTGGLVQTQVGRLPEEHRPITVAMTGNTEADLRVLLDRPFVEGNDAVLVPHAKVSVRKLAGSRRVHLIENGYYLAAEPSGALRFDRHKALAWETFLLISHDEMDLISGVIAGDVQSIPMVGRPGQVGFSVKHGSAAIDVEALVVSNGGAALVGPYAVSGNQNDIGPTHASQTMIPVGCAEINVTATPEFHHAVRQLHLGNFGAGLKFFDELEAASGNRDELATYREIAWGRLNVAERRLAGIVRRAADAWERDWLDFLLPPAPTLTEAECLTANEHETVIVIDGGITPQRSDFYREAASRRLRIVLFHLSDEAFKDSYDVYRFCGHVFRNYYSPLMARWPNVSYFPLGYKSGFAGPDRPRAAGVRKFLWSFAGDPNKSSRRAMLDAMRLTGPGHEHLTSGFAPSDALDVAAYSELMQDSLFTPCPRGFVNLDSFRVYEALEAGSVPIVERHVGFDYFTEALGNHPFPSVLDWREAPLVVKTLCRNDDLDSLIAECFDWWMSCKAAVKRRMSEVIMAPVGSPPRIDAERFT